MLILAAYDLAFFKAVFLCAVALGLIVFIHELGHFLVAKACGVRCDKFYIGFDFFGLKLLKFKIGETEYGIGVFPLGGYVKMLGQEDNPGETRERIAKARAARDLLAKNADAKIDQAVLMTDDEIAEAEKLINDPRSYQAKSVPQRMAIIVAGVTMNVIFAFVAAVLAFMLGTNKIPCEIGSVHPGQAAWESGLQSDDTLLQIEKNTLTYFDDISKNVMLGDHLADGIHIQYRRGADPTVCATKAYPKKCALSPMLGATQAVVPVLESVPVTPASPTYATERELKEGDVLVGINDTPIRSNLDYQKALYATTGENVTLKFLRPTEAAKTKRQGALKKLAMGDEEGFEAIEKAYVEGAEAFEVMAGPQKARNFGVVLTMGPVQCVRANQNGLEGAGRAGIVPGDRITGFEMTIDGKPQMIRELDPAKLPFMVQTQARFLAAQNAAQNVQPAVPAAQTAQPAAQPTAQTAQPTAQNVQPAVQTTQPASVLHFAVLKKDSGKEEIVPVEFSLDVFSSDQFFYGSGELLAEVGLTYEILPKVAAVIPGSEAEKQGIGVGYVMKSIAFEYAEPAKAELSEKEKKIVSQFQKKIPAHNFREDQVTWPMVYHNFMMLYPLTGTSANVVFAKPESSETVSASLPLVEYVDSYVYHSDLNFEPRLVFIQEGFTRSLVLGGTETWNSLTMVYRMLGKLFTGQVSVKGLGGPVLIAQVAYSSAREGLSRLLIFVCLISANLAVLNLLPIPVLDGGHVVFLLWEGITGKAPNENLMIILSYMGLLLFLGLTIFVLGLDLGFIARF